MDSSKNKLISISYSAAQGVIANQIYYYFKDNNIELIKDDISVKHGDNYHGFIEEVAKCQYILMVISREFLHSIHCMEEAVLAIKYKTDNQKIIPIYVSYNDIENVEVRKRYITFWNNKLSGLINFTKKNEDKCKINDINKQIKLVNEILDNIDNTLYEIGMIRGYEIKNNKLGLEGVCKDIFNKILKKEPKRIKLRDASEFIKDREYEIFNISDDILRMQMVFFIDDLKRCSSIKMSLYPEEPGELKIYKYIGYRIVDSEFGPSLYLTLEDENCNEIILGINDIQSVEVNRTSHSAEYFKYYIEVVDRNKRREFEEQMKLPEKSRDIEIISSSINMNYVFILNYIEENAYENSVE